MQIVWQYHENSKGNHHFLSAIQVASSKSWLHTVLSFLFHLLVVSSTQRIDASSQLSTVASSAARAAGAGDVIDVDDDFTADEHDVIHEAAGCGGTQGESQAVWNCPLISSSASPSKSDQTAAWSKREKVKRQAKKDAIEDIPSSSEDDLPKPGEGFLYGPLLDTQFLCFLWPSLCHFILTSIVNSQSLPAFCPLQLSIFLFPLSITACISK